VLVGLEDINWVTERTCPLGPESMNCRGSISGFKLSAILRRLCIQAPSAPPISSTPTTVTTTATMMVVRCDFSESWSAFSALLSASCVVTMVRKPVQTTSDEPKVAQKKKVSLNRIL
jgi:hypothetical protein